MSKYDDFDEHWCRAFAPIQALHENWAASGDRLKEYAAANGGIFRFRFLIKPEEGFVSPEHEDFFVKNWNINRRHAHYYRAQTGFSLAPVWKNFRAEGGWLFRIPMAIFGRRVSTAADQQPGDQVDNCKQPFIGNQFDDEARAAFEHHWESGLGASNLLYRARHELAQLDKDYAWLKSDADRQRFIADHPGYRPKTDDDPDLGDYGLSVEEKRAQIRARQKR